MEESRLYVTDYAGVEIVRPEGTLASEFEERCSGDSFYVLDSFYTSQKEICRIQVLNDGEDTGEEFDLDPINWGIEQGSILGMDVPAAGRLVFWVGGGYGYDDEHQWTASHFYAVSVDSQMNLLESVDLADFLREEGIWANRGFSGNTVDSDGTGNLYIRDVEQRKIYVLDSEGNLKGEYGFEAESSRAVLDSFHTAEGEVVFLCGDMESQEFVWLDAENGSGKRLAAAKLRNFQKCYGLYGNILYYAADNQLIGWDVSAGRQKILLDLTAQEIVDPEKMALQRKGEDIRLLISGEGRYILTLSAEEPERQQLVFANICEEKSFLNGRVVTFSRENPQYAITYENAYQEEEKDRILLELANGGGPDLLYVPREELKQLQSKGVLADLNLIMEEDTLKTLLPGAVAMGTYGDELSGLPVSVYLRSILTKKDYWQEDTWTAADVMGIMEERTEMKGLFMDMFGQDNTFYNMYFMVGIDMEHSSFLEDGKGFDCTEFQDTLRFVREKSNEVSVADQWEALKEGEYLGIECAVFDMASFGSICQKLEDDGCMVGYPTETGQGTYMQATGMLAVNRNALEKEGVRELVNYLFGLDSQQRVKDEISVRLDVPGTLLKKDDESGNYYWTDPYGQSTLLRKKQDGTSYLDEYVSLLGNAAPFPVDAGEVFDIVMEEADAYFYSDKELDEVTKAIQNRVQLYLEENRS